MRVYFNRHTSAPLNMALRSDQEMCEMHNTNGASPHTHRHTGAPAYRHIGIGTSAHPHNGIGTPAHPHNGIGTSAHLHIFIAVVLLLFTGCDPAYYVRYAVLNDSGQPVYCVDKNKRGAAAVTRIETDSAIVVYEESGFGFGKAQFKISEPEVAQRFVFYSDSALSDSSRIVPEKGWKYYRLPLDDYNARVYIRAKDLKK